MQESVQTSGLAAPQIQQTVTNRLQSTNTLISELRTIMSTHEKRIGPILNEETGPACLDKAPEEPITIITMVIIERLNARLADLSRRLASITARVNL